MEFVPSQRQRLPRETRLLLTTAFLAIVAIWVLARLRFQEPASAPAVVGPILAPLMVRPAFDELAAQISEASNRVAPSLFSIQTTSESGTAPVDARVSALRLRDDLALIMLPRGTTLPAGQPLQIITQDVLTGLSVVRTQQGSAPVRDSSWIRHEVPSPRFLMRSDPFGAVSLRPFYAAALSETEAPLWSAAIWQLPQGTDVKPGSFVFTGDAEWVGMIVAHAGGVAVVPADILSSFAERLLANAARPRATVGLEVQALTAPLRALTGASSGVAVTYVAPPAVSGDGVRVGDILESADGRALSTIQHWQRYLADVQVDVPVVLHVRRGGTGRDITVVPKAVADMAVAAPSAAGSKAAPHPARPLGLELRTVARIGAEVLSVQPSSLASAADLRVGDVITMIGSLNQPTAVQVQRTATRAAGSGPLLLAIQRGDSHRLVTLEP